MNTSDTLLLRLTLLRWHGFVRDVLGASPRSRLLVGSCLALLALSGADTVWRHRGLMMVMVLGRPLLAGAAASVLALLIGAIGGRAAMNGARRDADLPWLATLPWSSQRRNRALQLACLPMYGLLTILVVATAALEGCILRPGDMAATVPAGLGLISIGFVAAARFARSRQTMAHRRAEPRRQAKRLAFADRLRPCWLGNWALNGRGATVFSIHGLWLTGLAVLGMAGSIQTGTALPGAMVGLLGGHLVFLVAQRSDPLCADALRVLPVGFPAAAWGVLRLPMLVSLGWFVVPAAVALAMAPADPVTAGCLIGLLALNALAGLAALRVAGSTAGARLLHIAIVGLSVHYSVQMGISEAPILLALAVLLWHGARRRFIRGTHRHDRPA